MSDGRGKPFVARLNKFGKLILAELATDESQDG